MTTIRNTSRVLVNASPKAAFDYVSDLTKHPEWSGGPLNIESVSSGPVAVGNQYRSIGGVHNKLNELRVTRFEPPDCFAFVATDPQFGDITHEFLFTAQDAGTLISRTVSASAPPLQAFVFRVFLYPRQGKPLMDKAMAALKNHFDLLAR